MRKLIFFIGSIIALNGCATTQKTVYMPTVQKISEPPIGSIVTAGIGDKLLVQGEMTEQKALCFPLTQKFLLGGSIQQGCFAKQSENDELEFYNTTNDIGAGKAVDLTGTQMPMGIALRKSDNAICAVSLLGTAPNINCKKEMNFEKKNWVTSRSQGFQQTLLYNGKVGNKINIGYREFSSDMARPAFNNDVEYDLSESKQIGYKGALLEVIEANNQMIKYKVIKNFN